ncbi:MAG: hypothetical protein J4F36_12890 [Nitrosopumilaceae archaeon]|nr:hypothetical protein [Nitrosopumilaceae archaeon]
MREIETKILTIFHDSSHRPKITPRHEGAIAVMLENYYTSSQIQNSLNKLEKTGKLFSVKYPITKGIAKFYFLVDFKDEAFQTKIEKKVKSYALWIEKYSSKTVTDVLGNHLHELVKKELELQNFEILVSKDAREFNGNYWTESKHSLDIIARHIPTNLIVGVEVKNRLYLTSIKEIKTKICMCNHFGILPIFAGRWMEPHRKFIESNNGFLWQFKHQIYPSEYTNFVDIIKKRFKFPVIASNKLPYFAKKEFTEFITKIC